MFSSSFSGQTATGQPWPDSRKYLYCDQPYNSFLAIYRVDGREAIEALRDFPFSDFTDRRDSTNDSVLYCFMSRPPA